MMDGVQKGVWSTVNRYPLVVVTIQVDLSVNILSMCNNTVLPRITDHILKHNLQNLFMYLFG